MCAVVRGSGSRSWGKGAGEESRTSDAFEAYRHFLPDHLPRRLKVSFPSLSFPLYSLKRIQDSELSII